MNVRRIAWFGVSGVALASWFAAASTSGVRPPIAPVPPGPTPVDRSMSSLQSEIRRLHDRLGPAAAPTGSRDLFRFSPRVLPRSTAHPVPSAPDGVVPPAPASPSFTLIGIAEDTAPDGSAVRTAIVSGGPELFLVKPGESIQGRYRVDQVSSDAVQLVDTTTRASIVLPLR